MSMFQGNESNAVRVIELAWCAWRWLAGRGAVPTWHPARTCHSGRARLVPLRSVGMPPRAADQSTVHLSLFSCCARQWCDDQGLSKSQIERLMRHFQREPHLPNWQLEVQHCALGTQRTMLAWALHLGGLWFALLLAHGNACFGACQFAQHLLTGRANHSS